MILKLITKDFKVSGRKIFLLILAYMLLGGIFYMKFYPWNVFMMAGYFLFSTAASYFSFMDKRDSSEILMLSLPVSKGQIVAARYITSLITFIAGLTLWYLTAFTFNEFHYESSMSFEQILYIKVLFIAFLFFSIQQSIFLPSFFGLSFIWMIIVFIISIVIAVLPIPILFQTYKKDFNPLFTMDDFSLILILSIVILSLIIISFTVSNRIYKSTDN